MRYFINLCLVFAVAYALPGAQDDENNILSIRKDKQPPLDREDARRKLERVIVQVVSDDRYKGENDDLQKLIDDAVKGIENKKQEVNTNQILNSMNEVKVEDQAQEANALLEDQKRVEDEVKDKEPVTFVDETRVDKEVKKPLDDDKLFVGAERKGSVPDDDDYVIPMEELGLGSIRVSYVPQDPDNLEKTPGVFDLGSLDLEYVKAQNKSKHNDDDDEWVQELIELIIKLAEEIGLLDGKSSDVAVDQNGKGKAKIFGPVDLFTRLNNLQKDLNARLSDLQKEKSVKKLRNGVNGIPDGHNVDWRKLKGYPDGHDRSGKQLASRTGGVWVGGDDDVPYPYKNKFRKNKGIPDGHNVRSGKHVKFQKLKSSMWGGGDRAEMMRSSVVSGKPENYRSNTLLRGRPPIWQDGHDVVRSGNSYLTGRPPRWQDAHDVRSGDSHQTGTWAQKENWS